MDKSPRAISFWLSSRFACAILGFFGFINLYGLRTNLSVAVVCMLNYTEISMLDPKTPKNVSVPIAIAVGDEGCGNITQSAKIDGEFAWVKNQKGIILGSFYYGYLFTQIVGGLLAERFGGRRVIGWSMALVAIATILCGVRVGPTDPQYGYLVFLRILVGLGEGMVYPAMHSFWSGWAPPLERSRLCGFTYAGGQVGNALTFPASAEICAAWGWSWVFYVEGGVCAIWCILWLFLVADSPANHPRISAYEKKYIQDSLGNSVGGHTALMDMPWLKIMTSSAVWAIIVGHTCANFGTYLMLTSLPMFMADVLKFDIKSNGLLSAVPYVLYFIMINVAAVISDFLRSRKIMTTGQVRKLMMFIALGCQAAFFMGAAYCNCHQKYLAVGFVALAQGMSGFQYGGVIVNHVDIAPRYAGTLYGISNTFATIPGFIAPIIVAQLTSEVGTRREWQSVFWVASGILLFGAIFFGLFAQGELQSWAGSVAQSNAKESELQELTPRAKVVNGVGVDVDKTDEVNQPLNPKV